MPIIASSDEEVVLMPEKWQRSFNPIILKATLGGGWT